MDPGFHYHRAVARLVQTFYKFEKQAHLSFFLSSFLQMSEIVLNLSESLVLPLDVLSYGTFLQRDFNNIESRYKAILESNGVTLGKQMRYKYFPFVVIIPSLADYFRRAVSHFRNASEHFTSSILPRVDKHE